VTSPPTTLLFDLGGVLYEASTMTSLGALLGTSIPEAEIKERWLSSPAVRGFELGRLTPEEFAAEMVDEWRIPLAPQEFMEQMVTWVKGPYEGAEALLERLRAGYRVCCLTNSNGLHWSAIGAFLEHFDVVFSSHLLGEIKPDEAVFVKVLDELDVEPGSVWFFDDSEPNVRAAERLGIRSFLVNGFEELTLCLTRHRLI